MTESERLRHYNAWRRGDIEVLEISPKEIGILLDSVTDQMAALEALRANPFRHVPLPPSVGSKDIAAKLTWLSDHMFDICIDMDYYGGFDKVTVKQSRTLFAMSAIVIGWSERLFEKVGKNNL